MGLDDMYILLYAPNYSTLQSSNITTNVYCFLQTRSTAMNVSLYSIYKLFTCAYKLMLNVVFLTCENNFTGMIHFEGVLLKRSKSLSKKNLI